MHNQVSDTSTILHLELLANTYLNMYLHLTHVNT